MPGSRNKPEYTGSIAVKNLTPHDDGLIHYGDRITFEIDCDAPNLAWSLQVVDDAGKQLAVGGWYDFQPGWPGEVTLASQVWESGPGHGSVLLYHVDGKRNPTLDVTEFEVKAEVKA